MRKWGPLVAVCLGVFMLLTDVSIVIVALPDIGTGLDMDFDGLQWVLDGYALALAALLLGLGALADRVGRRRVYTVGLAVFALASPACGLAPDGATLVGARIVQAGGGAAMFATAMALLNLSYRGRDRAVAFGVWGSVSGAAAAVGPVAGGLLTEYLGWRSIFLVNLPLALAAVVLARRTLPESRDPAARRLDLPGAAAFTVAAGAAVLALIRGGADGWTSPAVLGAGTASVVALTVFVLVERRSPDPLLAPALLRRPAFTGVLLCGAVYSATAFSGMPYISLWLQSALGLGPMAAGLTLLPMSVVAFAVPALAGRRLAALPVAVPLAGGLAVIGLGTLLQGVLDGSSGWAALLPGLALTGLGVGAVSPVLASAAMAAVPPERGGMAGGALNTFRQLGQALGIAVLGLVLHGGLRDALAGHPAAGPDPEATAGALASGRPPAGLPGELLRTAFATGLDRTLLAAGLTALAGAALVAVLLRRRPERAGPADGSSDGQAPARVETVLDRHQAARP
ncbi:MFS transporter [Kitasatospora purpeofusca]|uniref:MFS transporter n=1 Tax=Kitasatospora purpeofusca TaxID=67352 RepID=UPI002251BD55|nr:MFS transporter [Kitasatospora purpeofusca]MCX4754381.1 MFS transporter [Kitasatospora purpeofusca]WSR33806.1 MFS transporter [Kitasatospora purpeofusca]